MIRLDRKTVRARGCKFCATFVFSFFGFIGTNIEYFCEYEECPYSELNKYKNYVVDTHKETMEAEIRMNKICRRLVEEQGD